MARLLQMVATGSAVGIAATSSWGVAGAVRSTHGSDYSEDYQSNRLQNCDRESDSNHTQGVYDFDANTGGGDGDIEDSNGNNGDCAQTGELRATIKRHRTCERNLLAWDCDNWADTKR